MREVELRFYAELNDFLEPTVRGQSFAHRFYGERSVKDLIEALGVPHTEVELLLVDGRPVGFDHRLRGGERVAVYPVFEQLDLGPLRILRGEPMRDLRFCADCHLGRLARYLRLLGFDTWYRPEAEDQELSRLVLEERRILLTRDRGLLKRGEVERGYFVRETEPIRQLAEVARRFHLEMDAKPFSRCLRCNSVLICKARADVRGRVPERVLHMHSSFKACPGCGRVYWTGTHYKAMAEMLARCGLVFVKSDCEAVS